MSNFPPLKFTMEDAINANSEWGCNCGPTALAAITNRRLEEVRRAIPGFENKKYTSITMMRQALNNLIVTHTVDTYKSEQVVDYPWPSYLLPKTGLVRVKWQGPWNNTPEAERHSHWIARYYDYYFDVNCLNVGGWVHYTTWLNQVAPWIMRVLESGSYERRYYPAHGIHIIVG